MNGNLETEKKIKESIKIISHALNIKELQDISVEQLPELIRLMGGIIKFY